MGSTLLIAWREYKQYVFSRGFLLFLIMTPVLFLGAVLIMSVVDKARPQRTFVIVDQTGGYTELIDAGLEKQHLRETLQSWSAYLNVAVDPDKSAVEDLPEPFGAEPITNERLEAVASGGGVAAAAAAVAPYLKDDVAPFQAPRPRFRRLEAPQAALAAEDAEGAAAALEPYLLGERALPGAEGELFAAVIIPSGFGDDANTEDDAPPQAAFWSKNVTDPTLQIAVSRALRSALRRQAAANLGLAGADLNRLADIEAPITAFTPGEANVEAAEIDDADRLEKIILPGVMTYVLLVVVFAVGNPLLTNTIEERSNKIVEVLLSSVTADQLMSGKLIGIAAVGLTMPTIFLVGGFLASAFGATEADALRETMAALIRSNLLFVYFFYFLAAYVIFAMIFLAIGALSNSLQDAQTFMGPLMMVVFAPMPFAVMVFQNPNGLAASILTWIPIYTPYAVMLRIASDPPMWEILGATALMLVFAGLVSRVMGRVFRNNILNNAPPKVTEIWRLTKREA
ncbi:MAG: ABC transporter permease [Pseudomonadota bacterium]